MLCRSFIRWINLAESRAMFVDSSGRALQHCRATLTQTLQVLAEHHCAGDTTLTHAALQRLLNLDATNEDTALITSFSERKSCSTVEESATSYRSEKVAPHLILRLMQRHVNDVTVRERCCRCVANMCQLGRTTSSCPHAVGDYQSTADMLVDQGAVELVLGTLSMYHRLSPQGRAWTALAALNLVCLSEDGSRRAVLANGEAILSNALLRALEEPGELSNAEHASDKAVKYIPDAEQRTSVDAALGAIARLLITDAGGLRCRYEEADFGTISAIVRSLSWLSSTALASASASALESAGDGENNEEKKAALLCKEHWSLGSPQTGDRLDFCTASSWNKSAVVSFIPPLQKAWMSLKNLTSCDCNLPMVFEALYQVPMCSSRAASSANTGMQVILKVVKLFGVRLTGLEKVGFVEEMQLQKDMIMCAVGTFVNLTSMRKDLGKQGLLETEAEGSCQVDCSTESNGGGVSAIIPTETAVGVMEILSAGTASDIALSAILRIHTSHRVEMERENSKAHVLDTEDNELLVLCLQLLANLAEEDITVSSPNTLAIFHALLLDSTSALSVIECKCRGNGSSHFPTLSSSEQTVIFQQCGVIARIYAVLWAVLRTPNGVRSVAELCTCEYVERLQNVLEALGEIYHTEGPGDVNSDRHLSPPDCQDQSKKGITRHAGTTTTVAKSGVVVEETLERLMLFGRKVLQSLKVVCAASPNKENTELPGVSIA